MKEAVRFAIEAWVTAQQDTKARNWVLDYAPPMPGETVGAEERLMQLRVQAVEEALKTVELRHSGISTGPCFHKLILCHVHEYGAEFSGLRSGSSPLLLQRTLQGMAQHVWPTLAARIEDNLERLLEKWSLPKAV